MVECLSAPLKRLFSVPQDQVSAPAIGAPLPDRRVPTISCEEVDQPRESDGFERETGQVSSEACSEMVERIRRGDREALEELYAIFSRGIRFYFCRHAGPRDVEDKVHDSFLIVVERIRRGDLRDPTRLLGYIRTVARRQVAQYISKTIQERREHHDPEAEMPWTEPNPESPESAAIRTENSRLIAEVLRQMPDSEKRILELFYIQERTQQQICEVMNLTPTQYRLLKSRAKSRFGEIGKVHVGIHSPPEFANGGAGGDTDAAMTVPRGKPRTRAAAAGM
jgi:RNA polymerase sigma-70 factor (ECF subfamily)